MAVGPDDATRIQEAKKLSKTNPGKAEAIYKEIVSKGPKSGEQALKNYDDALLSLGQLYRDERKPEELAALVKTSRSALSSFAKAKTAKLGMIAPSPAKGSVSDQAQSDSSLTSLARYRTRSRSRSPSRKTVSHGPFPSVSHSSAKTSRPGWSVSTCKNSPTTTPSR